MTNLTIADGTKKGKADAVASQIPVSASVNKNNRAAFSVYL